VPLALLLLFTAPAFSADLLHTLWSPAELAGSPDDARQGRTHAPDDSPPARVPTATGLPPLRGEDGLAVRHVSLPKGKRLVALTFDLCELSDRRAGYDATLVNLLRAKNVRATFFAGGRWMLTHPEKAMQLMADPLFELGGHGWTHGNMAVLDQTHRDEQILWTLGQYSLLREELTRRATAAGLGENAVTAPKTLATFRPPYARCSPEALAELADMGLRTITWDVVTDEGNPDPAIAARDVAARVRPGSIVLMHANGVPPHTARIVELLLPMLQEKGYAFATVGELLGAGRAVTSRDCWFNHPGDSRVFDAKYGDGTRHLKN